MEGGGDGGGPAVAEGGGHGGEEWWRWMRNPHIMMHTSIGGPVDVCCDVPFTLRAYGNGLTSLVHDLHALIHAFHASEWSMDVPKCHAFGKMEG